MAPEHVLTPAVADVLSPPPLFMESKTQAIGLISFQMRKHEIQCDFPTLDGMRKYSLSSSVAFR